MLISLLHQPISAIPVTVATYEMMRRDDDNFVMKRLLQSNSTPDTVTNWVLFAFFILFALVSPYLSSLFFTVLLRVTASIDYYNAVPEFVKQFKSIVTHGLISLFLYLALVVFLPVSIDWLKSAINQIIKIYAWGIIWLLSVRGLKYILFLVSIAMKVLAIDKSARAGITEALSIIFFIIMAIISIELVFTLPLNPDSTVLNAVWNLFVGINIFTVMLSVAITPFVRDIVAGLTLFSDRPFRVGEIIEIGGVCERGVVIELRLRCTVIRQMDEKLVFIPNSKFLRYLTINYSRYPARYLRSMVFIDQNDAEPEKIRILVTDIDKQIIKPMTSIFNQHKPKNINPALSFSNANESNSYIARSTSKGGTSFSKSGKESNLTRIESSKSNDDSNNSNKSEWEKKMEEIASQMTSYVYIDDAYALIVRAPVYVGSLAQYYKELSELNFKILELLEKYKIGVRFVAS